MENQKDLECYECGRFESQHSEDDDHPFHTSDTYYADERERNQL